MGLEEENTLFLVHYNVYCFNFSTGNQCLQYCIHISTLKSGLLHFTGQPYCKNCRSAKAKDGIINLILRNYLIDRYIFHTINAFYAAYR